MKKKLFYFAFILFILGLINWNFSLKAVAKEQEGITNVLILNSYDQGLKWTRDETQGIVDILSRKG